MIIVAASSRIHNIVIRAEHTIHVFVHTYVLRILHVAHINDMCKYNICIMYNVFMNGKQSLWECLNNQNDWPRR